LGTSNTSEVGLSSLVLPGYTLSPHPSSTVAPSKIATKMTIFIVLFLSGMLVIFIKILLMYSTTNIISTQLDKLPRLKLSNSHFRAEIAPKLV
jgi:hypothetical protein